MGVAFPGPILAMGCRPNRNRIRLPIFAIGMLRSSLVCRLYVANLRLFIHQCILYTSMYKALVVDDPSKSALIFSPALPMVVPEKEPQELRCDVGCLETDEPVIR